MTKGKLSPRHIARALAVQGLYYFQVNPKTVSEIEDFLHDADSERFATANYELLNYLLSAAVNSFETNLNLYTTYSSRPLSQIEKVEQGILVIAAIELANTPQVPAAVVINEAVELAKTYGSTDSFKFINGLVDKLAAQLRSSERTNNKFTKA